MPIFAEGAGLSHSEVQQLQRFRKVEFGSAVQISRRAQRFLKTSYRFVGRRSAFALSITDFVAGAALSQGQVQISWQAQRFIKCPQPTRGRLQTPAHRECAATRAKKESASLPASPTR